jgi:hypothetical protein
MSASPPVRPSAGSHARAFLATVAGTGDIAPDDPHRKAKIAGGFFALLITALFLRSTFRSPRADYRAGYRAGRAAERAKSRKIA